MSGERGRENYMNNYKKKKKRKKTQIEQLLKRHQSHSWFNTEQRAAR